MRKQNGNSRTAENKIIISELLENHFEKGTTFQSSQDLSKVVLIGKLSTKCILVFKTMETAIIISYYMMSKEYRALNLVI